MDMVSRIVVLAFAVLAPFICGATTHADVERALDQWQPFITEAAHRFAIPPTWIRDVMRAESAGQEFLDDHPTTSSAGAMGLMQIMPTTYAELRDRYGLGADPYHPHDNILAGAAYLRELYERYGWPSLFAAYHAGPTRFDAYLSTGQPLPEATREYLARLISEHSGNVRSRIRSVVVTPIFVPMTRSDRADSASLPPSLDDRLFVRLRVATNAEDAQTISHDETSLETSDARDP